MSRFPEKLMKEKTRGESTLHLDYRINSVRLNQNRLVTICFLLASRGMKTAVVSSQPTRTFLASKRCSFFNIAILL
jgi:hypothetical protein